MAGADQEGSLGRQLAGCENRGKRITYHNVARDLTPIGKYSGKPVALTLPKRDLMRYGAEGCTVLLQMDDAGPIIAAAEVKD